MKITNKYNYPMQMVRFAESMLRRPHDTRISITRLCDSPQILRLLREKWDVLERDVSQMTWALISTAIHAILQQHAGPNALAEEKLIVSIDGVEIAGIPDLYENEIISDWKFVKTSALYYQSSFAQFEKQLNCYDYMFHIHGFPVKEIQDVLIFRDWSAAMTKDPEYPQFDVQSHKPELWGHEKTYQFIKERLSAHANPEHQCTDEERWAIKPKFAVMKKGQKRSKKNHDNVDDARFHASELNRAEGKPGMYYVEDRPGDEWKRCREYCDVSSVCPQYRKG